jgi:DNA-binding XRE family transcriptional regulator
MGVSWKSLMWWERNEVEPGPSFYPALIGFLGYEPWPEPQTLAEALLAERRRRGLNRRAAAQLMGIDETTIGYWERGEWKATKRTLPMLDAFLRCSVRRCFPDGVR